MDQEIALKRVAIAVYVLNLAGFLLTGITIVIALIIAHVKLGDARNTWLDSHFRWQIRSFWFALLWCMLSLLFLITDAFLLLFFGAAGAVVVWFIYRNIKGLLRINEAREMYSS